MLINQVELERRLKSSKNLVNSLGLPADDIVSSGAVAPETKKPAIITPAKIPGLDEKFGAVAPNASESDFMFVSGATALNASEHMEKLTAGLAAQGVPIATIAMEMNVNPNDIKRSQTKHRSSSEQIIDRIRELALDKLLMSLGLMTQDKFEDASLKDLANVTSSLAKVLDKTAPVDKNTNIQFHVYAPQVKPVGHYKTIDV